MLRAATAVLAASMFFAAMTSSGEIYNWCFSAQKAHACCCNAAQILLGSEVGVPSIERVCCEKRVQARFEESVRADAARTDISEAPLAYFSPFLPPHDSRLEEPVTQAFAIARDGPPLSPSLPIYRSTQRILC